MTWRNPFVYFHSLIDTTACADGDVGLDALATDLKDAKTAPSFAYIVPSRCHDGSPDPCAPGQPSGLAAAEEFLRTVVPQITASAAYKDAGLIAITFDQAPQTGPDADPTGCCDTPAYPNLPAAPAPGRPGRSRAARHVRRDGGGGRVGMLLISSFVKPGSSNEIAYYNHFSFLRSIEDLFGLDHLGYANNPALPAFDKTVYNAFPRGR